MARRTGDTNWQEISEIVENQMRAAKGLHTNIDFPIARAYFLMGIPVPLCRSLFVMSRITGWSAHIREPLADNLLIRPANLYDGPHGLHVAPFEERE